MNYKALGLGLGLFSIALGAAELLAPKRITRALESEGHEGLVKGFGAREVYVAGDEEGALELLSIAFDLV